MISRDEAAGVIDRALAVAEGDECDATFDITDRNVTRFAGSGVHQNMSEISRSLTLRVIRGGRMGIASTTSTDEEELRRVAGVAATLADHSDPVEKFAGLYRGGEEATSLPTLDEETANLDPRRKAEELREMFDRGRQHGVTFAGSYSTAHSIVAAGNSHGVRRVAPMTAADATVIALHEKESGYAARASRSARGVGILELGHEAEEKATKLGGTSAGLEPGTYDVVLEPAALIEILEWLDIIAFCGKSYEDGSSFLVDRFGQPITGANVTIEDDALDTDFLPFPFDMEGLPKQKIPLITNGKAGRPAVDMTMASKLGFPPNAGAGSVGSDEHGMALHISMLGGTSSREEMIASTERGIWVTRFHYINGFLEPKTALMTGTTRDGTFLIESGKVTRRLPNLRWTQPMLEAFARIDSISRERRIFSAWWNPLGGFFAPTVKVRDWSFTGV